MSGLKEIIYYKSTRSFTPPTIRRGELDKVIIKYDESEKPFFLGDESERNNAYVYRCTFYFKVKRGSPRIFNKDSIQCTGYFTKIAEGGNIIKIYPKINLEDGITNERDYKSLASEIRKMKLSSYTQDTRFLREEEEEFTTEEVEVEVSDSTLPNNLGESLVRGKDGTISFKLKSYAYELSPVNEGLLLVETGSKIISYRIIDQLGIESVTLIIDGEQIGIKVIGGEIPAMVVSHEVDAITKGEETQSLKVTVGGTTSDQITLNVVEEGLDNYSFFVNKK